MTADDTVTAKLAEWEALTEGATDGPWEVVGDGDPYLRRGDVATRGEPGDRLIVCENAGPDAEFIAAARTIAPALLGFVREVREGHEPEAETRAFDPLCCARCREEWPCPTEQAAQKWLGGEG